MSKRNLIMWMSSVLLVIGGTLFISFLAYKFGPVFGNDSVGPNVIRIISEFSYRDYIMLTISLGLSLIASLLIISCLLLGTFFKDRINKKLLKEMGCSLKNEF